MERETHEPTWIWRRTGGWIGSSSNEVYGTDVPSYRLEYTLADAEGGKTLLTMKIAQEGVGSAV